MNKERNAFLKLSKYPETKGVSIPKLYPPPKVVGKQMKKMEQKEVFTNNNHGNKLPHTNTSTENNDTRDTKNLFNSVEQEKGISNTIKELLNSQQSNPPGKEAAKETVLLEEDSCSIDLKSVNELLPRADDGLIKKLVASSEGSEHEDRSSIHEEHFSDEDEFSSLEDGLKEEFFIGKDGEGVHHQKVQESDLQQCNYSHKKNPIIIKLPVLLSSINIEIEIFDTFNLLIPMSSISKIDWSIHSLENRVLLPSTFVFFKGIFVANIEYVNDNGENSVHNIKIQVPWEKAASIKWVSPPIMPSSSSTEYTFQPNNWMEKSYHHEYQEQFADPFQHTVRSINFVWNEDLDSQLGTSKLAIQGTANLCIDLLQEQYISLTQSEIAYSGATYPEYS